MMAKPIRALELHHAMIQFSIIRIILCISIPQYGKSNAPIITETSNETQWKKKLSEKKSLGLKKSNKAFDSISQA